MRAKIVYTNEDTGGLVLVHPAYDDPVMKAKFLTEAAILQYVLDHDVPSDVVCHIVEEEDWPTDHSFVDAWEWED